MIATIFQAAGAALIAIGVGAVFPPLGVVVAGVGVLLFGLAIERGQK
jgi:hypothetical protein